MKLIRDQILWVCDVQQKVAAEILSSGLGANHAVVQQVAAFKGVNPEEMFQALTQDTIDFYQLYSHATVGQTIVFSADQALALRPALERFNKEPDLRFPFPATIIQFDRPIPEREFFAQEEGHWTKVDEDSILGIVCAQNEDKYMVTAFFASNEIQTVKWMGGTLDFEKWVNEKSHDWETARHNKKQVQLLVMACMHYINCENVELERVEADKKVNKKRISKGKRPLPDYYVVKINKTYYREHGENATGYKHSFRYDVRGHFRHMSNGKVVWVNSHQRGLEHELYKPKVYKVNNE